MVGVLSLSPQSNKVNIVSLIQSILDLPLNACDVGIVVYE